jgi:hypothetical protein
VLYDSDIDRFARENKDDFEARLHEYAELYPELGEVTTDLTKDEMAGRAKEIISEDPDPEGVSDEVKKEAIADLAERQPDAALVPRGQAVLRIEHPDLPHEQFELNVFGFMNEEDTTGALDYDNDPGPIGIVDEGDDPSDRLADETRPDQMDVNTTPITDVPSWAAPEVFDRIISGRIGVYESPKAAQRSLDQVTQQEKTILGDESGNLRMKQDVEEVGEHNGEVEHEFYARPTGNFNDPSQEAAWNVLNETIEGEPPIPTEPEHRVTDTSQITEEEKARVRRRIKTCLENPRRFADVSQEGFDKRQFFNQLLQCEFGGWTPPRTPDQKMAESMREDVFRIIREFARDHGFEVVGDYVRPRPDQTNKIDFSEGAFEEMDDGMLAGQTVAEEVRD